MSWKHPASLLNYSTPRNTPELLSDFTQKKKKSITSPVTLYSAYVKTNLSVMGPAWRQERPTLPHDSTLAQKKTKRNLCTLNFSLMKRKRTELCHSFGRRYVWQCRQGSSAMTLVSIWPESVRSFFRYMTATLLRLVSCDYLMYVHCLSCYLSYIVFKTCLKVKYATMFLGLCSPRKHPLFFAVTPVRKLISNYASFSGTLRSRKMLRHCI